ncbi:MAG: S41 family peptidase [Muribaculaceae bacterium]|nr:S41 family peptidase [Muribaculaceae bacterium]
MTHRIKDIKIWIPLIVAVSLGIGIFAGTLVNRNNVATTGEKKLSNILDLIGNDYVDRIDTDSLLETVYPDLLQALDPHSSYIPSAELRSFNEELDGSFSGIGISFTMNNDSVNVVEVIAGGPAEKAGILPGDRIITVDDESVVGKGLTAEKVRSMIKGMKGSTVKVGVKRESANKMLEYEIERGDVPVNSIDASYIIDNGIGYIHVNQFSRTTYNEFLNSLATLAKDGAETFIIDLRGNLGGYLEMAVLMANEILPKGAPIVFTKTRDGLDDRYIISDGTGAFPDAGIVILLDEYSASSSEVFSGAIQDNDRGLIIGRRSFGKGLIQRQTILPDSSALQLTVGRYYTPSGRSIQKDYSNQSVYRNDIVERYNHGEAFSADSIHQDTTNVFLTANGRKVYGGGGIMPDVFVPSDTAGVTGYYLNVANAGLFQKFTFDYADTHRKVLSKAKTTQELLQLLPDDDSLLRDFINYASKAGIPARWYYINISRNLIVDQLKAMIARDILGYSSSYEILNQRDPAVNEALKRIKSGEANSPVEIQGVNNKK